MLTKWLITFICGLLFSPLMVSAQQSSQIHEIAQIGRPSIKAIDWNPTQDLIAVATANDIWLYDTQLEDVAHLDLAARLNLTEWSVKGGMQPISVWSLSEVKWSPDGKWLIFSLSIITTDGTFQKVWQIWDWDGNEFRQVLGDRFQFVTKIEWNAAKSQFAVQYDNQVELFTSTTIELRFSTNADDFAWNHVGTQLALTNTNHLEIIDTQTQQKGMSLSSGENELTQIVWSPDDTKIGAVSANQLLIWDVESGKKLSGFESEISNEWPDIVSGTQIHEKLTYWLWLPDSKQVVVSYEHPVQSFQNTVVYDVETTDQIYRSPNFQVSLFQAYVAPLAKELIATQISAQGTASPIVWNIETWEILNRHYQNTTWVQSPDQQLIIGYSFAIRTLTINDASTLEIIGQLEPVIDKIRSLSWSADSQRFAIASADEIQIWDIAKQQPIKSNLLHNGDSASVVGWNNDGSYVTISSKSIYSKNVSTCPSIRTWNTQTDLPISKIPTGLVTKEKWATKSDKLLLFNSPLSTCIKAFISIWNPIDGEALNINNDFQLTGNFDINWEDNDTKFSVTIEGNWHLFDAQTGQLLRTIPLPTTAAHVAWLPSDNLLLAQIYRYDDNQKITYSLDFIDATTGAILNSIPDVQRFSLASDQATIALYYETGSLEIWKISRTTDMPEYQIIRILPFNNSLIDLWWNPQSTGFTTIEVTSSGADGLQHQALKMWDLANLENPQTVSDKLYLGNDNITSFAWHPDGKSFATSQTGGIIKIWTLEPQ